MASIEKRVTKSGPRWRVVWWQDGARQQQTYGTLLAAKQFKGEVEGAGNAWPVGRDPRERLRRDLLTFAGWAARAVDARSRANERTKADYRRDLERHFALLADVPLDKVDSELVATWEADRRDAGLSEKTIRNLHGFASSIMADALTQHPPLVTHNPFGNRLAKRASVRTEEMVFFNPGEFDTILRHIPDERAYRELVRLMFATGIRYGEATALKVGDVELLGKRKTITITKAWKRLNSSEYVLGEPKTVRSRRTLSLPPSMVDMLVPLVSSKRSDELLFPGAGGGRLPHTEVYKRAWAPAVARANVCATHYVDQRDGRNQPPRLPAPCDCPETLGKTPRIHDIRHSWVSALISEGIALEVISRRAGHSSITITYDRYGHLDPRHDADVDAAMDRVLAVR